ncbi:MAG: UDP-glucose 4-epimerase GalE [Pseudomonadota bacterium]
MQSIIVTGGAGYIGSHVCKVLAQHGFQPVTYDNLSRGNEKAVQFGPFEKGDIQDMDRLAEVFEQYKPVGVIHMAALAYVRESVEDPLAYYENNVGGSTRLIAAMVKAHVPAIVFSSTCATYGVAQQVPILEDHSTKPINPYGHSKLMVEQVLADADATHGLRSTCLRYFNACGSDPDGQVGEWHDPETHVIPLCMMAARGEIEHFTLLGDDHETEDGTPVRDYIHVMDLAEAHVLALKRMLEGGESVTLNLGVGNGISVKQIVEAVEHVSGLPVPVKLLPRHPADPPVLIASGDSARELLGFEPQYTDVNEIIAHAWMWRQKAQSVYTS